MEICECVEVRSVRTSRLIDTKNLSVCFSFCGQDQTVNKDRDLVDFKYADTGPF